MGNNFKRVFTSLYAPDKNINILEKAASTLNLNKQVSDKKQF